MQSVAPSLLTRYPRAVLAVLLAIFAIGLAGTLPELSRYHGDERYYTDAAIAMAKSGDYLTPRYAEGRERLNKPVLSYWLLAASHRLLGVNLFASRLPFLLAGCGVLWLTWRLGRTLFRADEPALLGAAITAANLQTITLSTRSTPDILLALFVTVSLLGFGALLVGNDRRPSSYALAYIGAGLACATKGLWGLMPVIFAIVLWRMQYRKVLPFRALAPPLWVIAGAIVGFGWFGITIVKHGFGSLGFFLKDQTAFAARPPSWFFIANFADYAFATIRHFLPWTAFAVLSGWLAWPTCKRFHQTNRAAVWFIVGWYLLILIVFAFGFVRRTRYLFPTYPGVGVVLAALLLAAANDPKVERWLKRLLVAISAIGLGAALVLVVLALRWSLGGLAVLSAVLAIATVAFIAFARRAAALPLMFGFAVWVTAAFSVVLAFWMPLLERNSAPELARQLSTPPFAGRRVIGLDLPPLLPSQIRIVSGGVIDPQALPREAWPKVQREAVLIVREDWHEKLKAAGYQLTPSGYLAKRVRLKDLWNAARSGNREDLFVRTRQRCYLAAAAD